MLAGKAGGSLTNDQHHPSSRLLPSQILFEPARNFLRGTQQPQEILVLQSDFAHVINAKERLITAHPSKDKGFQRIAKLPKYGGCSYRV